MDQTKWAWTEALYKKVRNPSPSRITIISFEARRLFLNPCGRAERGEKGVAAMYLQFYINDNGDKVYTTKKESPLGLPTESAHPARFSPDDKYSRQRFLLKKRFGLLPTQQSPLKY